MPPVSTTSLQEGTDSRPRCPAAPAVPSTLSGADRASVHARLPELVDRLNGVVRRSAFTIPIRSELGCSDDDGTPLTAALVLDLAGNRDFGNDIAARRHGQLLNGCWGVDVEVTTKAEPLPPLGAEAWSTALLASADPAEQLNEAETIGELPC